MRFPRYLAAAALVAALGAGCGSASSSPPASTTTAPSQSAAAPADFPVTIKTSAGPVAIAQRPTRIVSLSPTATEMLYAIGAGGQVAAVDADSDYPVNAPHTNLSGFQPNIEAIASYSPDLVIASNDPGGLVKSLNSLHIPVLLEPAAQKLTDSYSQIRQLGTATGHAAQAATVANGMRTQIAKIIASVPRPTRPLTVYNELDDTYFSATSSTFIGQIYHAFGLRNIADKAKGAGGGYPQLSSEYIVAANPSLIFLGDTKCCHQSAATVAARPGWSHISAVVHHEVVPIDDDIASRWGPRVVSYYRIVARHVAEAEKQG